MQYNPLIQVAVQKGQQVHRRRALSPEELQKLRAAVPVEDLIAA
jgi:hypothetical protein